MASRSWRGWRGAGVIPREPVIKKIKQAKSVLAATNAPPRGDPRTGHSNGRSEKRFRDSVLNEHSRCYWCNVALTELTATTDHLVPVSRGGANDRNYNYVLACGPCNVWHGNKLVEELELPTDDLETFEYYMKCSGIPLTVENFMDVLPAGIGQGIVREFMRRRGLLTPIDITGISTLSQFLATTRRNRLRKMYREAGRAAKKRELEQAAVNRLQIPDGTTMIWTSSHRV